MKICLGNKIINGIDMAVAIDGQTLKNDTVTPDTLVEGYTAHDAAGNAIVGTAEDATALEEEMTTQDDLIADIFSALEGKGV